MNRRRVVCSLAVLLAVIVVFLCQMKWKKDVLLSERYPILAKRSLSIQVMLWPEGAGMVTVSDEKFQHILMEARVTKRAKTQIASDEGLLIHLFDDETQTTYSVEVGKDRSISVARTDDLRGTRTFWTDCTGDLFSRLYVCYRGQEDKEDTETVLPF